jgi:hypothetical protein
MLHTRTVSYVSSMGFGSGTNTSPSPLATRHLLQVAVQASGPDSVRAGTSDIHPRADLCWQELDIQMPFSPRVIVDAGANIMSSLYFSQRFPVRALLL